LFINVGDKDNVKGTITWTLLHAEGPLAFLIPRIGHEGTEYIGGTWDVASHKLRLAGTSVSDTRLIACDEYDLTVSADGEWINGITKGNDGSWSNQFHGRASDE
jgi:hypothetical protein